VGDQTLVFDIWFHVFWETASASGSSLLSVTHPVMNATSFTLHQDEWLEATWQQEIQSTSQDLGSFASSNATRLPGWRKYSQLQTWFFDTTHNMSWLSLLDGTWSRCPKLISFYTWYTVYRPRKRIQHSDSMAGNDDQDKVPQQASREWVSLMQ